jgi:hypothetical protein
MPCFEIYFFTRQTCDTVLGKKKDQWYWMGFVATAYASFYICHSLTLS